MTALINRAGIHAVPDSVWENIDWLMSADGGSLTEEAACRRVGIAHNTLEKRRQRLAREAKGAA